jgi:DNA-binding MarR family transcriptional regulator
MNCPSCHNTASSKGKKWKYGVFNVELFACDNCLKTINVYYKNGKFSHTILSGGPRNRISINKTKIKRYLKEHNAASDQEISKKLGIQMKDVHDALLQLQYDGAVERAD